MPDAHHILARMLRGCYKETATVEFQLYHTPTHTERQSLCITLWAWCSASHWFAFGSWWICFFSILVLPQNNCNTFTHSTHLLYESVALLFNYFVWPRRFVSFRKYTVYHICIRSISRSFILLIFYYMCVCYTVPCLYLVCFLVCYGENKICICSIIVSSASYIYTVSRKKNCATIFFGSNFGECLLIFKFFLLSNWSVNF